jgi:hypothetical protein
MSEFNAFLAIFFMCSLPWIVVAVWIGWAWVTKEKR